MNKNKLQQLREAIILALHPECDYFLEALGKEADYLIDTPPGVKEKKVTVTYEIIHENFETFAFPLTIGRIMQALGDGYWFDGKSIYSDDYNYGDMTEVCNWKSLNVEKRELLLEEQSDETKQALYEIFLPSDQTQ